ncbi:MAG: hypothetical protein ACRCWO_03675 [Bosea sp. (in: a-proteobacteria)]
MSAIFGSLIGSIAGFLLAMAQVKLVRAYSVGKPEHIKQRAYDTIDQLKLTSFLGLPLIFAIVGYMAAVSWFG